MVIRLTPFRTQRIFMGTIGHLMSGSGLEDILELVYASNIAGHILSGSVLLITAPTLHGLTTDCSLENLNTCRKLIHGFEDELNSAVVPTLDPSDMRTHCDMYYKFESCIKPFQPNCRISERRTFEGSALAYNWLCEEAFDEYISHHDCLKNPDLHREGSFCNTTLRTKMDIHLEAYNTSTEKRDRLCLYIEDYLDCVENAVESFCDRDAAIWQRELDTKSMRPLLQQINCPGWTSALNQILDFKINALKVQQINNINHLAGNWNDRQGVHLVILSVLIAASILIFFFAIVIILYIRRRRKTPQRMTSQVVEPPEPPPYTPMPNMAMYQPGAEGVTYANSPDEKMTPPPYSPPSTDMTDMAAAAAAAGDTDNPCYAPYQESKLNMRNQPDATGVKDVQ
ncbi:hypothetical protein CAPTEDRAFT_217951 [Capitella teleta]|uniref:Uncharacterized protein n=1 Tax=Capitella teleta TaxID=283909 RepID=R7UQP8_CAPTE|nr:hypothetical protein CAPTEDRAFT_217951 [Capitella teleta]|eukprot:ELU08433.1 hypothetical protein CAPTEDRAFT_217951 [Capitella teleta]